jgi:hypothetical protein
MSLQFRVGFVSALSLVFGCVAFATAAEGGVRRHQQPAHATRHLANAFAAASETADAYVVSPGELVVELADEEDGEASHANDSYMSVARAGRFAGQFRVGATKVRVRLSPCARGATALCLRFAAADLPSSLVTMFRTCNLEDRPVQLRMLLFKTGAAPSHAVTVTGCFASHLETARAAPIGSREALVVELGGVSLN